MAEILVVAAGPLLEEAGTTQISGQCMRTSHFIEPMKAAGHQVRLLTVPIPGASDPDDRCSVEKRRYKDLLYYKAFTSHDEAYIINALRSVLHKSNFDAVVGINAYPAYLVAQAAPELPFWADLYGWTMAEGQTRAALVNSDRYYDHFWRLEVAALLAADRFSTASARQGNALYGELAMVGRLNRHTFDWPFATTIPTATSPIYDQLQRTRKTPPALADKVPDDAHMILWSGGFNTWTDVDLLAESFRSAMEANPNIHLVATGGAVVGHDDKSYVRFQKLAAEQLPADRVHLLGWVETELVVALHARADVGINVDCRNTETHFGARTRLTHMMGAGLPVLTTRGTEIAEWIEENRAGEVVASGDVAAFADALIDSAADPNRWQRRAQRARKRVREAFDPQQTLADFLEWCGEPKWAPDRDPRLTRRRGARKAGPDLAEDVEALLWARLKVEGQVGPLLTDRESLRRLRAKWPLRLWRSIKSRLKG
ncbi:glycosyltransferase [bacterium]|nr:glycosyltransferase [bacterium]